jgi:hypothetical protein
MRTENTPAHPWMLEDVGLRAQQAADLWAEALHLIAQAISLTQGETQENLTRWHASLAALRRRAVANACHLRATLIAVACRRRIKDGLPLLSRSHPELKQVLLLSRTNHSEECQATGAEDRWDEMDQAIKDLEGELSSWLDRWLQPSPDQASKGIFSLTST